jgi:hypothetical protein
MRAKRRSVVDLHQMITLLGRAIRYSLLISMVGFLLTACDLVNSTTPAKSQVSTPPTSTAHTVVQTLDTLCLSVKIIETQHFEPTSVIDGPAVIHPDNAKAIIELGNALRIPVPLSEASAVGLSVRSGQSVTIPQVITLYNGSSWTPTGAIERYENDDQLRLAGECALHRYSP